MSIETQGAKPHGRIGQFVGKMMNLFHTQTYIKYFADKLPKEGSTIVDIGCGEGKFINYLAKKNRNYTLIGIDHSEEMIKLSQKINSDSRNLNRLEFIATTVDQLYLKASDADLITAFETIQFWKPLRESLARVHNNLKNDGRFLIINRYPKENSKWWHLAQIKNSEEYKEFLSEAGFKTIKTDLTYKKGWVIVEAVK